VQAVLTHQLVFCPKPSVPGGPEVDALKDATAAVFLVSLYWIVFPPALPHSFFSCAFRRALFQAHATVLSLFRFWFTLPRQVVPNCNPFECLVVPGSVYLSPTLGLFCHVGGRPVFPEIDVFVVVVAHPCTFSLRLFQSPQIKVSPIPGTSDLR